MVLAAALVTAATLCALALVAVQTEEGETRPGTEARQHAEAACELTTRAGEAAESGQERRRARYAASVLLLDWAIIESGRAAESDAALGDLDAALEAAHAAGHARDPDGWRTAMRAALAECGAALG